MRHDSAVFTALLEICSALNPTVHHRWCLEPEAGWKLPVVGRTERATGQERPRSTGRVVTYSCPVVSADGTMPSCRTNSR